VLVIRDDDSVAIFIFLVINIVASLERLTVLSLISNIESNNILTLWFRKISMVLGFWWNQNVDRILLLIYIESRILFSIY
jgi:hypothetical protein